MTYRKEEVVKGYSDGEVVWHLFGGHGQEGRWIEVIVGEKADLGLVSHEGLSMRVSRWESGRSMRKERKS